MYVSLSGCMLWTPVEYSNATGTTGLHRCGINHISLPSHGLIREVTGQSWRTEYS